MTIVMKLAHTAKTTLAMAMLVMLVLGGSVHAHKQAPEGRFVVTVSDKSFFCCPAVCRVESTTLHTLS